VTSSAARNEDDMAAKEYARKIENMVAAAGDNGQK